MKALDQNDGEKLSAEQLLWEQWRGQEDMKARDALLDHYLPYARIVAASYYKKRITDEIEFSEYHQWAIMGLIEAATRFDPGRGVGFRTFAARRMHGTILNGLETVTEKHQQIAARAHYRADRLESIKKGARVNNQLSYTGNPKALFAYLAEIGVGLALSALLEDTGMLLSEDEEIGRQCPYIRTVEYKHLHTRITQLITKLPAKERQVLQYHYLHEISFEEIANILSLTKGRISQIHSKALIRVRTMLGTDHFDTAL